MSTCTKGCCGSSNNNNNNNIGSVANNNNNGSSSSSSQQSSCASKQNNNLNSNNNNNTCRVCNKPAKLRCSRCKQVWYCCKEHQLQDWPKHKKNFCDTAYQMNQHELHKKTFDTIIEKYKLNTEEKSNEISELLSSNSSDNTSVTAEVFANKFGMDVQEAVVFLEWIKVGITFKQQTAKNASEAANILPLK